jgi:hypothetical protein
MAEIKRRRSDLSSKSVADDRSRSVASRAELPHITADDDAIARRAYELFERRGGKHGHDVDDWIQAEADIRAQLR